MGSLHVARIFASGGAQAANRLVTYYNSIHPLASVFDAFLLGVGGGQLRADLDVKVFKLLSETDIAANQAAIRQPDSDRFWRWEVAGAALIDFHLQGGTYPPRRSG
jgi:Alpha/beta hydrolase domain